MEKKPFETEVEDFEKTFFEAEDAVDNQKEREDIEFSLDDPNVEIDELTGEPIIRQKLSRKEQKLLNKEAKKQRLLEKARLKEELKEIKKQQAQAKFDKKLSDKEAEELKKLEEANKELENKKSQLLEQQIYDEQKAKELNNQSEQQNSESQETLLSRQDLRKQKREEKKLKKQLKKESKLQAKNNTVSSDEPKVQDLDLPFNFDDEPIDLNLSSSEERKLYDSEESMQMNFDESPTENFPEFGENIPSVFDVMNDALDFSGDLGGSRSFEGEFDESSIEYLVQQERRFINSFFTCTSPDVLSIILNKIDYKNVHRVVLTNEKILDKYSKLQKPKIDEKDWLNIYLQIDSVSGYNFSQKSTYSNLDRLAVLNEKTYYDLIQDAKDLSNNIESLLQKRKEEYKYQNKKSKKFTLTDTEKQELILDSYLELAADVVFNIEVEWYSKQLVQKNKIKNFKRYVVPSGFTNPLVREDIGLISNQYDALLKEVSKIKEYLKLDLNNFGNIEDFFFVFDQIVALNYINRENDEEIRVYTQKVKDALNFLVREFFAIDKNWKAIFKKLVLPYPNKFNNFKKINSEVPDINSFLISAVESITNDVTDEQVTNSSNITFYLNKVFELNKKILHIHQEKNKDIVDLISKQNIAYDFAIKYNLFLKWLKDSKTNFSYKDEGELANKFNFGIYSEEQLNVNFQNFRHLLDNVLMLSLEEIKQKIESQGIFFFNSTLNNCFLILNVAYEVMSRTAKNAYEFLVEHENDEFHETKILSTLENINSKLLDLYDYLSIINNKKNHQNFRRLKLALKSTLTVKEYINSLNENENVIGSSGLDWVKDTLYTNILVVEQIVVKIIEIFKVAKDTEISLGVEKMLDLDVRSEKLKNFSTKIRPEYSSEFVDKKECDLCHKEHIQNFVNDKIIYNYKDSTKFKHIIYPYLNQVLNFDMENVDTTLSQQYLFEKVSELLVIENGILSSLMRVNDLLDTQITRRVMSCIDNEINEFIEKDEGFSTINQNIFKFTTKILENELLNLLSLKLFITKNCLVHKTRIDILKNKLKEKVPQLSNPALWIEYVQDRLHQAAKSVKELKENPLYSNNEEVEYLYHEFSKHNWFGVDLEGIEKRIDENAELALDKLFIDEQMTIDEWEVIDETEKISAPTVIVEKQVEVINKVNEIFNFKDFTAPVSSQQNNSIIDYSNLLDNIDKIEEFNVQITDIANFEEQEKEQAVVGSTVKRTIHQKTFKDVLQQQAIPFDLFHVWINDTYEVKDQWNAMEF